MTGGPEQSAGEERGDARLRAGGVRWQVGPERALCGSRPVWADRVREGVGLGTCWAERTEGRGSGPAGEERGEGSGLGREEREEAGPSGVFGPRVWLLGCCAGLVGLGLLFSPSLFYF